MDIGGYTTAILTYRAGWNYLLTIPVAGVLASVGGVMVGIPALKLRGIYLATATFALAISAPSVIRHFDQPSGGSQGISIPPAEDPFGLVRSQSLTSEQWLYYSALVLAVVLFLFSRAPLRSHVGRAFRSIPDSEAAAAAHGVTLPFYKTRAFALRALY